MKVVFLGIDGVLATRKTRYCYFEKECVDRLMRLLSITDAKVVLASTWRLGKLGVVHKSIQEGRLPRSDYPPQENRELLQRIVGRTSRIHGAQRGVEIDAWLKENPLVRDFVILDDDTDMAPHRDRLVRTDTVLGLSEKNTNDAIRILKGEPHGET